MRTPSTPKAPSLMHMKDQQRAPWPCEQGQSQNLGPPRHHSDPSSLKMTNTCSLLVTGSFPYTTRAGQRPQTPSSVLWRPGSQQCCWEWFNAPGQTSQCSASQHMLGAREAIYSFTTPSASRPHLNSHDSDAAPTCLVGVASALL